MDSYSCGNLETHGYLSLNSRANSGSHLRLMLKSPLRLTRAKILLQTLNTNVSSSKGKLSLSQKVKGNIP